MFREWEDARRMALRYKGNLRNSDAGRDAKTYCYDEDSFRI